MFCFVRCGDLREGDQSLTNTGVFVKEVCSPQTEATTWPEGDALLEKQSVKKDKEKGVEGGRKEKNEEEELPRADEDLSQRMLNTKRNFEPDVQAQYFMKYQIN